MNKWERFLNVALPLILGLLAFLYVVDKVIPILERIDPPAVDDGNLGGPS